MLPSRKRWRNRAPCHDTTAVNSIAVKSKSSVKMGFCCFLKIFGAVKKWKATHRRSQWCHNGFSRDQKHNRRILPLLHRLIQLRVWSGTLTLFVLLTFCWKPLNVHSSGIQETQAGVHIFDLARRQPTVRHKGQTEQKKKKMRMVLNICWA